MREIKFRILRKGVPNKEYKEWDIITSEDFFDDDLYLSSEHYDKETLSQYTGLKDAKGKEIYEGDVIRVCDGEEVGQVIWNAEWACFELSVRAMNPSTEIDMCNVDWEVIGNIYENPELLTQEK